MSRDRARRRTGHCSETVIVARYGHETRMLRASYAPCQAPGCVEGETKSLSAVAHRWYPILRGPPSGHRDGGRGSSLGYISFQGNSERRPVHRGAVGSGRHFEPTTVAAFCTDNREK